MRLQLDGQMISQLTVTRLYKYFFTIEKCQYCFMQIRDFMGQKGIIFAWFTLATAMLSAKAENTVLHE
jgi:hypothetical protein